MCRLLDGVNHLNWLVGLEAQKKNVVIYPFRQRERKANITPKAENHIFSSEARKKNVIIYPFGRRERKAHVTPKKLRAVILHKTLNLARQLDC